MSIERALVAIFIPSLAGGGAERIMLNLAQGIATRGYDVDMVLASASGPYLSNVPPGVRVVDLGSPRLLRSLAALAGYLREKQPQVLLSTLNHANIAALAVRQMTGLKIRVIIRQADAISSSLANAASVKDRFTISAARWFYSKADGIVAVSRGVADDLAESMKIPRHLIRTIYNPVITPDLEAKSWESLNHPWFRPGQPPVILGAGRLSPQKDFATLIRAFALVRARRPLRLLILGEGDSKDHLKSLVLELGLAADVSIPGFAENPFNYMRRSSLFVLSSVWEGLPGVLIQAMACGCPVVSTDCPCGPAEVLYNGELGPLIPVGDVTGLAAAIEKSLDKPADPQKLIARSRDFSLGKITDLYLSELKVTV